MESNKGVFFLYIEACSHNMLTRVPSKNPQDPQDPQDASFRACNTGNDVERRSQAEWLLESDIYDNDFLDPDACFMLLVVLTFSVPLCSFLFFAYFKHALAEV